MKKEFPFEKVVSKLDSFYNKQEELEREDATASNPALWQLQDQILGLELALEAHRSRDPLAGGDVPLGVAPSSLLDK